jgi:hypothetical protein
MGWISGVIKIIPMIVTAVEAVERLFKGKTGSDKKEAALDIIKPAIEAIESLAGKELMQEEEFRKLISEFMDTYVAIQNYVAAHQASKKKSELNTDDN